MLKLLFIAAGGLSGIVGWASFSAPNWDPKNLWRITVNNKFYLSSCFNDPFEKTGKITVSNLSIYLTTKGQVSEITDSTQLELRAQGYREKVENNKTYLPTSYEDRSLQNIVSGSSGTTSDYQIRKYTQSGNIQLGETGGGEDSETFGGDIKCNNKFFDLEGTPDGVSINIDLSKVTFKLKAEERDNNKYNGHKVYSIEIATSNSGEKELKWADGFEKPIVIIPSS